MPSVQINKKCESVSIKSWLSLVRSCFKDVNSDMLGLFDVYAEEAVFGRRYINDDTTCLPYGARLLEVGAGSLLLSCQLVREGFQVTALEPIGTGFSHFDKMRSIIIEQAVSLNCLPEIIEIPAEKLTVFNCFDYVFSVNVMEHVSNVSSTLYNVMRSLKGEGTYRFCCPNYLFPYEPHFNIPTFFSKKITEWVFKNKIMNCQGIPDPTGTWNSLNWINVLMVRRILNNFPDAEYMFNRDFLKTIVVRIGTDPEFASRRSRVLRDLLLLFNRFHMQELLSLIPTIFQPIIDCHVRNTRAKRV